MARKLPPAFLKKKKKAPPFQGKVIGGAARKRADRKAYRKGGAVSKADVEPISPNEPNAPAGGAVRQKFQTGGSTTPKAEVEPLKVDPRGPLGSALIRQRPAGTWKGIQFENEPPRRQGGGPVEEAQQRKADVTRRQAGGPRVGEDIARRRETDMRPYTEEKFLKGQDEAIPKNYKDGGDAKWIGKARESMERRGTVGSLRKAMGAKEGQKIPTSSLQSKKAQAKRTGNTAMMKKVQFALNVRK